MNTIADNLDKIHQQITLAVKKRGSTEKKVALLAVSKTKPATDIALAYQAGQRLFGENYVQEAVEKIQLLAHLSDIEWHMIGPIQSNKTQAIAEHFNWVQSVDRSKIIQRLNAQRPAALPPLNVCIQVNISGEDTKSGCHPQQVAALAAEIDQCPHLQLRGLMAIPQKRITAASADNSFDTMADLFRQLQQQYPQVDTLSMGMSDDLNVAIAAGSTLVRIGTAIFGRRD